MRKKRLIIMSLQREPVLIGFHLFTKAIEWLRVLHDRAELLTT